MWNIKIEAMSYIIININEIMYSNYHIENIIEVE